MKPIPQESVKVERDSRLVSKVRKECTSLEEGSERPVQRSVIVMRQSVFLGETEC